MRFAGVLSGDDDGVKGIAFTAAAEHPIDQFRGDFLLGHTGADDLQGLFQCFLTDPLCGDHAVQFLLVLGGAQLFHQRPCGMQPHTEQTLKIHIFRMTELAVFGCERGEILLCENLPEQAHFGVAVVIEQDLGTAACGCLGCFDVAGVGDQPGFLPGDQDKPVREGKAGGIALVFLISQQNGAETTLGKLFLDLNNVIHIPVSSDVGRGKLTMKTEPCGLLFPTRILPPWAVTASCTILRPRPLPPL